VNELALFAGAGGGILGGKLLGWRTVCGVELDAYARSVLIARQDDGCLEPFPIWDDIRTFDGRPWRGVVDVVSGGFPCQDISVAGKGEGIDGARSGLWREMARVIGEVGPRYVFVENSPALTSRGLGTVLGDLASMGYDAKWGVLGACHSGAPHKRLRIWILADSGGDGWKQRREDHTSEIKRRRKSNPGDFKSNDVGDADSARRKRPDTSQPAEWVEDSEPAGAGEKISDAVRPRCEELDPPCLAARQGQHPGCASDIRTGSWWSTEPDVGRVVDGVASRVDRLRCIGNGQVPAVAALAWKILTNQ
jgi:DNA (cytosine-5)-methyltransferase 1